jgi:hypothetical protein
MVSLLGTKTMLLSGASPLPLAVFVKVDPTDRKCLPGRIGGALEPFRAVREPMPKGGRVNTITTVGLGDLAPSTTMGKLFTVVYIFAGLGIILGFIDAVANETLSHRTGRGGSEEGQEDASAS